MPQVVVSPAAAGDLVELRGLLSEQFGEIVADKKLVRLHLLLKRLESFPELGRRRDSLGPGLRSFAIRPDVVLYRLLGPGLVDIIRIVDGRRDHQALLSGDQLEDEP